MKKLISSVFYVLVAFLAASLRAQSEPYTTNNYIEVTTENGTTGIINTTSTYVELGGGSFYQTTSATIELGEDSETMVMTLDIDKPGGVGGAQVEVYDNNTLVSGLEFRMTFDSEAPGFSTQEWAIYDFTEGTYRYATWEAYGVEPIEGTYWEVTGNIADLPPDE